MNKRLMVVADENIPLLDELLGDIAEIRRLPGRGIRAQDVADADALLVRSVTRVDAALVDGSRLRFVGSCTIGVDHVDMSALQQRQIAFAHAPGCNAAAVVDYVLAAMLAIEPSLPVWQQRCVGIVGLGQVGSRLQQRLLALGINVKACDPFQPAACHSLAEVLGCDAISLHVPLSHDGEHPTWHLLDSHALAQMKDGALLINSSRGAVVDNTALPAAAGRLHLVLDVYEHEPVPAPDLLDCLDIATAHIAGYSLHGKMRGTLMVVEKMAAVLGLPFSPRAFDRLDSCSRQLDVACDATAAAIVRAAYDIRQDSDDFLRAYRAAVSADEQAKAFDDYRKHYANRYEFSYTKVAAGDMAAEAIKALGFAGACQ
ncbi:MAG TPA: 4-phosphoerythronate dehydrogenase [Pseudomonadales bacterium]